MHVARIDEERFCRVLLTYARRVASAVAPPCDADDCAVVAVERALVKRRSAHDQQDAPGRAWIAGCVRHLAVDAARHEAAESRLVTTLGQELLSEADDLTAQPDWTGPLRAAWALLTPPQRAVIALLARGLTIRDIAVSLGVSTNTVYLRLSRARRTVRKSLGAERIADTA